MARKLLELLHPELELLALELTVCSHLYTLLGPRSSRISRFYNVLKLLWPQNFKNLIVCSDFNIDPMGPKGEHLRNIMLDLCLIQVVDTPTQILSSIIGLILLFNHSSLLLSCRCFPTSPGLLRSQLCHY